MMTFQKRFWSLTNNVIELILGVGMVAVISRLYTPEETGAWFLFIAIFALVSAMRDALVQAALVKSTVGVENAQAHRALKTSLAVVIVFEVITAVVIVSVGILREDSFGKILVAYPAYSLPNAWLRWQTFYLRSQLNLRQIAISNGVQVVVLALAFLFAWQGMIELNRLPILLGLASVAGCILLVPCIPYHAIATTQLSSSSLRMIAQMGFYGMLREAIIAVSSRISLFYSSSLLSMTQTATLGVSQRFAQVGLLPNNAFQSLLFPSLVREAHGGNQKSLQQVFENSLAQLFAFTLPLTFLGCVLSPFVLLVLNGANYVGAWPFLTAYLLLATVITPFGTAFGSLVTALGKPQLAFRVVFVNSVLNSALGYICMRWIGLAGAPMALALTEVFGFIWISQIVKREAGIQFASVFKQIPTIYYQMIKRGREFLKNASLDSIRNGNLRNSSNL